MHVGRHIQDSHACVVIPGAASPPAHPTITGVAPAGVGKPKRLTRHQIKASATWQEALWKKWPHESDWPGYLDVYESAAFLRVSPDTIRRALVTGRDGRALLPHSRPAGIYRIRKEDLYTFGRVDGRT